MHIAYSLGRILGVDKLRLMHRLPTADAELWKTRFSSLSNAAVGLVRVIL
jgi:hypothetical protein